MGCAAGSCKVPSRWLPCGLLLLGAAAVACGAQVRLTSTRTRALSTEAWRWSAGVHNHFVLLSGLATIAEFVDQQPGPLADDAVSRATAKASYRAQLRRQQAALAARHGIRPLHQYVDAVNGFVAPLTQAQLTALARDPNVVHIVPDRTVTKQQIVPQFLQLTGPTGTWSRVGGACDAGRGVVVGVVDTGIWPEHPAFASCTGSCPRDCRVRAPATWRGKCVPGESFTAAACNGKIVGARWFNQGWATSSATGDQVVKQLFPAEYLSARDASSHGTVCASLAAGNANVSFDGKLFSGVAPGANIASYKVLWGPDGTGKTSDIVAAIEAAVADGVDIISFSLGNSWGDFDVTDLAHLRATLAGILVSAAAGNEGPAPASVDNIGPWTLTVGAGTHDLQYSGVITLGSGQTINGATVQTLDKAAPLLLAQDAALSGAALDDASHCFTGTLDSSKVKGNIVVCSRGENGRVVKSQAVKDAGGVGMVLANVAGGAPDVFVDIYAVPTIHVAESDASAILSYMATAGPDAYGIISTNSPEQVVAPYVTGFSSRGPSKTAFGGAVLKPDLFAPGQSVWAATPPNFPSVGGFSLATGTSMSTPVAAGLAAVLKSKNPFWSPAAIKSAMMTSASLTRTDGSAIVGTPFDLGAGHVDLLAALEPGLLYDAHALDWHRFLCATGATWSPSLCRLPNVAQNLAASQATDLNLPSFALPALAYSQTARRRVTAVRGGTYDVKVDAPPGVEVVVRPSRLKLARGQSAEYTASFRTLSGAFDQYAFGAITWSGAGLRVRAPVAVQPRSLLAPPVVAAPGGAMASFSVKPGYAGALAATCYGLTEGASLARELIVAERYAVVSITVTKPAVAMHILLEGNLQSPYTALGMQLYTGDFALLATAERALLKQLRITVSDVQPSDFTLVVFADGVQINTTRVPFTVTVFTPDASPCTMTVAAPSSVTAGSNATVQLAVPALRAGSRHAGVLLYNVPAGNPDFTVVEVQA